MPTRVRIDIEFLKELRERDLLKLYSWFILLKYDQGSSKISLLNERSVAELHNISHATLLSYMERMEKLEWVYHDARDTVFKSNKEITGKEFINTHIEYEKNADGKQIKLKLYALLAEDYRSQFPNLEDDGRYFSEVTAGKVFGVSSTEAGRIKRELKKNGLLNIVGTLIMRARGVTVEYYESIKEKFHHYSYFLNGFIFEKFPDRVVKMLYVKCKLQTTQ